METRTPLTEESRKTIADRSYVSALINKWGEFLEGIPDRSDHDRYTLGVAAMLMENQSQYLQGMNEETRMSNVGSFTKFIFPVLRRVFPNLIANEIVSVQPMTAPVGAVFYLDYVYGTNKGATAKGNVFPKDFDRDYSAEYINGETVATGDGTKYSGGAAALDASLSFAPVRAPNPDLGFSLKIVEETAAGVAVQTITVSTSDVAGGVATFPVAGAASAGTLTLATGAITGLKFDAVPANGNLIKAYYFYDGEMNSNIPQVQLDVRKVPVEAIPRRLKAMWSSEAAEDLKAFHGIDAETEIVSSVAQEIALEIDREIIQDLYVASTSGTTGTWSKTVPSGVAEVDHIRSIVTTIATVSNQIHKKTLRAPANFIVTSPEISALIAQLTTHGDFRPIFSNSMAFSEPTNQPRQIQQHGQFGIYKVGTLMNKWMVYEDPFFKADKMLVGLKGGSFLDAGYVWAPYIPLQVTPTFLDPADFSFRKGLRTRYAKKLLRPEYYGQVSVTS